MLTQEQNELVSRVGRGTPVGELVRQYWLPALLSSELPQPDCAPIRVRLLGEDLVAFRDTDGQVGFVQANCPHRGAPLVFGRNEERGLRCIYHGWKYNVQGRCTAMPNVPPESDFKDKVRMTAYPCVERNGLIWAYMGSATKPPSLPRFDFGERQADQCYFSKQFYECNWLQVLEGDFDPSHSSFLHASLNQATAATVAGRQLSLAERENVVRFDDRSPLIMTVNTDYGLLVGARREAGPDYYWRLNLFAMPFYAFVPTSIDAPLHCNAWIPVDDDNTIVLRMDYHLDRAMTEAELVQLRSGFGSTGGPSTYLPPTTEAWGAWMPNLNRANNYGIDREVQQTKKYSGMQGGVWAEDKAVTEGMGSIIDRTQEQLGPSDAGIIQVRRMLKESATALKEHGAIPPGVTDWPNPVQSCIVFLPKEMAWAEVADALISGRLKKTAPA